MTVFLYHFHGLGRFDFSALTPDDLHEVQDLAAARHLEIVPTVYLRQADLPRFAAVVHAYGRARAAGDLPNIAGFAVEGPLLGPQGGIPRAGRWFPTQQEWLALARLGDSGLRYIVMAPDAMELDQPVEPGFTFADLLGEIYDHGGRIAVGHFHRDNPSRSARRLRDVLTMLHDRYESSPFLVLTDHLFNDMPRNFTHAFRSPRQQEQGAAERAAFLAHDWERSELADLLGPVPATLLAAARAGLLMPCLNFDGYHVDLGICRKTVDYLGADRLIALTDHTEVATMAAEPLTRDAHSGLWLRDDGLVAAGSSGYPVQVQNMRAIGLPEDTIGKLFYANPHRAIAHEVARRAAVRV